jgi:hypothetical protein
MAAREPVLGPLNSILTVVLAVVIFWLVKASLPWLLNSVWNAFADRECREIIAANGARRHRRLLGDDPRTLAPVPVRLLPAGSLLAAR